MNKAYLAGLIDGDGHIGFSKCRTSLYLRVSVINTNVDILEDLKEEFGGNISKFASHKGWKQGMQWSLTHQRALDLVDMIYPWLRVKRQQAQTAFAWGAVRPGQGIKWDSGAVDLLVSQMKWLNMRGPNRSEKSPCQMEVEQLS